MARFLILSINYAPEPTGFAPHATTLAEHFAVRGHDVAVITGFPFAPRWARWPAYKRKVIASEQVNGVEIVRVSHFIPRQPRSAVQRMLMEGTFALAAATIGLRRAFRSSAILYIGAQPAIALAARILSALSGAPYFVNVNDLAASAAADVGIARHRIVRRTLERVEHAAYAKALGATVLCRRFADDLIAHGFDANHIRVIPSPIDVKGITRIPDDGVFRKAHGIDQDAFVIMFSGSMGLKQGLLNVIEAASRVNDHDCQWVLVGEGEARRDLEAAIDRHRLERRVKLLPFQPAEGMAAMFAAADVLLLNQVSTVRNSVVPSKLLTYMAAGKPVIAAVHAQSQGAEILRDAAGGVLVPPDDPEALARAVVKMRRIARQTLVQYGQSNRSYAEQHFDRQVIAARHETFMLECLGQRPGSFRLDSF